MQFEFYSLSRISYNNLNHQNYMAVNNLVSERNKICLIFNSLASVFTSWFCHILGVAQLLNKNNGKPFTEGDESLFEVKKISDNVPRSCG